MPDPRSAIVDFTIAGVAALVVGLTWRGELIESTPVDENGLPMRAALPVPGTITLVDQHANPIANHEVPDLPRALQELAITPTAWLNRFGLPGPESVNARDLALSAAAARVEVDAWILATLYAPEGWF